jgi:predicted RNA-binding Zn-ribbon protein involved in translation (DUF1610 family)
MPLKPSEVKSRPVYAPLAPQMEAGRHWLVLEANAMDEALLSGLTDAFAPVAGALQTWSVGVLTLGQLPVTVLADTAALADALAQAGPFRVNHRLYVQGTEPFIWSVAALASTAGLAPEQLRLAHAGSLRRRVWCTHCHGFTEDVTTSTVPCAGCGRHLLVRDHFSRRHGAFMGVMVDAEAPGERPVVQEVFP